ncbi:MAG: hypothetical protein IKG21_12250 [Atopobiaceae bacterium]|nr:hypothetical protein [Atopobiaceae bacterium]
MLLAPLMALTVVIPLVSVAIVWVSDADVSERHHSHHDTYAVAAAFSWGVAAVIVFMGALAVLVGWMCELGVFETETNVVISFFDAFLATVFVIWLLFRRYRVVTFDDYMQITPFFGPTVSLRYDEISAMEWTKSVILPKNRNVYVFVGHRRRAMLWAAVDLDQILIRIDRFDVIENLSL